MRYQSVVRLTAEQQRFLDSLIERRRCAPTTLIRAQILHKADVSRSGTLPGDAEIARTVHASVTTVYRVRTRFAKHGFHAALFVNKK